MHIDYREISTIKYYPNLNKIIIEYQNGTKQEFTGKESESIFNAMEEQFKNLVKKLNE
jgi:hypothetical protein